MHIYPRKNANSSVVAVTNTATLLSALLDTAGSTTHNLPIGLNAVDLTPEDGDVRMLADGNTPTSTKGVLLKQGVSYRFRGLKVSDIQLIRTGSSNVAMSVQVGYAEVGES